MTRFTGIKAISFDGDQTLWDFQAVMYHSLEYVLKELATLNPAAASRLDIPMMIAIRNRMTEKLKGKVTNLEEIRLEAFKQTLRAVDCPDDDLASHLNTVYLNHRFEDIRPYDDVVPALRALKQRFRLGLLSNGNSYPERCGLEGLFDFVIFSQDCGFEKPDPEFYRFSLEVAGCPAGWLLHVGDSIENDVIGALDCGIASVWLNRDGSSGEGLPSGIPVIKSLSELLQMV